MTVISDIRLLIEDAATRRGMESGAAADMALDITSGLMSLYGGESIYISRHDRPRIVADIRRKYNGRNRRALMLKHGISRATFYRMIGPLRKR